MGDVLMNLTDAVNDVEAQVDALVEACTDPQGTDVAELLDAVRTERTRLQAVEVLVEGAAAKALLDNMTTTPTLRIERHRTQDRKAWQHTEWQRDARAKALQAHGLKGAQGVLSADGEVLDASVLFDLMATLQGVHGSTNPRTTALRSLGLDPSDYCETSPGRWTVKVTRLADETEEGDA